MSGNGRNDKGRKNNPSSGSTGRRGRASPNSTNEPRHTMLLTPIDMPMIIGVAGSNSQGAISPQTNMVDPLADLARVMRQAQQMGYVSQPQPQPQQMSHRLHPLQIGYRPRPPLTQTDYGFQPSPPPLPPPLHPQRGCQTSPTVLRTHGCDGFRDYFF
ncbi:unnamed protein product [Lactuca saligna]|uniref:Uncharacterized protein n=1 Tax=Lactuca saligna TaxID=75948 RepID=A0AA35ZEU1_LACSI|nr:unnamed protein product [Lactuca saligna]